jgi:hypothetical protein
MPAVRIPNAPPALVQLTEDASSPAQSSQKVTSRKKKRDERAMEDLRVAMKKSRVTMAQAAR